MSYFSEFEANGGMDPYAEPEGNPDEGRYSPCGCGDARCQIDGNDATNVRIGSHWFSADCVGLCHHCGEVDDLHALYREGYGRLRHVKACGDEMNEVRR